MVETIYIDKNLSKNELYKSLIPQVESLLDENDFIITSLANITAALKQSIDLINWAGFYIAKDDKLYLGPFQGKVACTEIPFGSGVCGTAAEEQRTIIVKDVNQFPGHIVCDADSLSEIVIPLIDGSKIYGVLDLDSNFLNSFDETDKIYLEKLCKLIVKKLDLNKFTLS